MRQGVPKPDSIGRERCRVEGCTRPLADLSLVDGSRQAMTIRIERVWADGCVGVVEVPIVSAETWNHGFCAWHLSKVPAAFMRRWQEAQNQAALERLWRTIADDLMIEERSR